MNLEFQIMCVDTTLKVKARTESSLIYLLYSNNDLWGKCEIKTKQIIEKDQSLHCKISEISSISTKENGSQLCFVISTKGKYEKIEPFRLKLLEYINVQNFNYSYVIKDGVSKHIACKLYPLINDLETLLRG